MFFINRFNSTAVFAGMVFRCLKALICTNLTSVQTAWRARALILIFLEYERGSVSDSRSSLLVLNADESVAVSLLSRIVTCVRGFHGICRLTQQGKSCYYKASKIISHWGFWIVVKLILIPGEEVMYLLKWMTWPFSSSFMGQVTSADCTDWIKTRRWMSAVSLRCYWCCLWSTSNRLTWFSFQCSCVSCRDRLLWS